MNDTTIHTLDARSNSVLSITKSLFSLNSEQVREEIVNAVKYTASALKSRGVEYANLKTSLTPQIKHHEIAFLFDLSKNTTTAYGSDIHAHLLPLFLKDSSHSVLHGDLIHFDELSTEVLDHFNRKTGVWGSNYQFRNDSELYCLYINHCSNGMVECFDKGLKNHPLYIGYIDTTYSSLFKLYISLHLCHAYIKHQNKIIQPHEDDCSEFHNQNTLLYPFERASLNCVSIQALYFDLFLSYKIERAEIVGLENDRLYSLNAISSSLGDINEFALEIKESKLEYLRREKTGTADRESIFSLPKDLLEQLIKSKLNSSYLYNLRFNSKYNLTAFDIVIEVKSFTTSKPLRFILGCSYEYERKILRVITMY